MRKLKMWIAETLAVLMILASCPADVQAAVLEPVENDASFSGDQNGVKTFPAGDNVTATFDEATATITLYSDGGTLQWDREYLRERYDINLEEVEYIRVAEDAGTIALPAFSAYLFSGCSKLKELDLSRFDTSKVSEIYYMFTGCESLESVDVSGIDTENINNLGGVFWDCKSLKSLDLSSWKLLSSEGTEPYARECFAGCESLTTIKTPLINTWDCIELPRVMYDEEDNGYSSLPKLNESITLSVKVHDYGDIVVGDGVTATFDNLTGEVILHSDGGVLWPKWIDKLNVYEDVESIRLSESSGTVYLPADSSNMFSGCEKLTNLDLSGFNSSNVTNMAGMFYGCRGLTDLDVSGLNTSKVTDMAGMFSECRGLTGLDLSNFDTSNVTDMAGMFYERSSLTGLDLSNFDTSNVTDMSSMFYNCSGLTDLDVSSLDTSKVTDMSYMFYECRGLTGLDLSNFDTSNVTNMAGMFSVCSGLTGLDVSSLDTSKVTDMAGMFSVCSGLTYLDLSNFDTSNVTDMGRMFSGCSSLTGLDLSNFDTSKVTDMAEMFYECSSLTYLDLSNFDTSNVTDMSSMFYNCSGLTDLDVSGLNTSKVTDMAGMFSECSSLTGLDLSNFDTSNNVTDMSSMFYNCSGLTDLDVSSLDTSNVTDMGGMFSGCRGLTGLDVSSLDTSKVTDMAGMFSVCSGLTGLDVSSLDTSKVTDMTGMFSGCSGLTYLDLSNFDTSKVTDMARMFYECSSLTYLDLSNFDTSKVTDMAEMFYECSSLTGLDLSNFDTSNVTDMAWIFRGCYALTDLDLSAFDLSSLDINHFPIQLPDNFYCLFIMRDFGFDVPEYYEALETLKTPKVNPFNRLVLPREMYDELGNAYRYLPVLSDSIQLASSKELAEERRVPASGIKLDRTEAVIKREESIKLTASVLPDTATYKVVNWESSDETIAVVSQDGLVTALKEGEADITATTVIGEHSAGCHVTVAAQGITGVRLNRSSLTLKRGDVSTLTAAVEPSYAENKSVIWSSSDETVASVDENGTITALKIGKTNITATTAEGGLTATCRLTVKAPAVSGIVIDMKKTTVKEGGTLRLTATVEPEDAANQTIYWSSNNKSVATVDKTGLVTAVKEGSAIIMATSAEGNFTASCTIIVQKNKEFIDVADPSEWYYESVYWAVRNGVTSGMGEGTFRPTAQLSRAQTVTFLYNLAGKPDVSGLDVKDFSDVPQNAWYSKAVRWAVANKITSGYGTGTFRPDATCTRAMIVTFLANYAKAFEFYKEPSASSNFKDVASDDWYKNSVDWAVENGITSGYGQGTFQPNKTCTRAMMVVFLKKTDALSKAA